MYERISLSCDCGWEPSRLREVGLTADRQLVIYWRCSHCRRHVYIVKPLTDCLRDCSSLEGAVVNSAAPLAHPAAAESPLARRLAVGLRNETA